MSAPSGTPQESNLADLVRRAAEKTPDRPAVIAGERRLSYAELDRLVDAAAAGLVTADLVAGFRIALAMANSVEFIVTYFGALRAGLVVVPLPAPGDDPAATADDYSRILRRVRARLVVADATTVDVVRAAVHALPAAAAAAGEPESGAEEVTATTGPVMRPAVAVVGVPPERGELTYDHLTATAPEHPVLSPVDPELLAVLLHTSGTGGRPRIAMLTHRALLASLELSAAIEPPPVRADDVVLGALPFGHVFGSAAVLGPVVHAGAAIVPVARFDAAHTLALIAKTGITVVPVVPPMLRAWVEQPELATAFAGVRLVLSGGAPLQPALAERFTERSGCTVHQGYGLTEAAATVCSTLCSERIKPESVGRPVPGVEVRVVDELGVDLARGAINADAPDPGEVLVRGPQLFSGYWPEGTGGPDAAGWFATGDLGYLDGDGDLFLIDRVREIISVSGFPVYPHEVESVIRELPEVDDAAVVGAGRGTPSESVLAFVVPARGANVDAEAVRAHCRSRLARFKCPTVVRIVPDLPRTAAGKIAKTRLWERTGTIS